MRLRAILHGATGISSQVLTSLGNVALSILIARSSAPHVYGSWAVGFAFYLLLVQLSRGMSSTPILLTKDQNESGSKSLHRGSITTAASIGVIGGLMLAVAGMIVTAPLRPAFLVFGAAIPFLLMQDAFRYRGFQLKRPGLSVILDGVWTGTFAVTAVVIHLRGHANMISLTIAWAVAAMIAIAVGTILFGNGVSLSAARGHLREHLRTGLSLWADTGLVSGTAHLLPVFVAGAAGLGAAGAFRAGQTLMGGVPMVLAGLTPIAIGYAASQARAGNSATPFMAGWSLLIAVSSLANGVVILALPEAWGRAILGPNWEGASTVVLGLMIASMLRGPLTGALILLRAQLRLRRALLLRLLTVAPSVGLPVLGAVLQGAAGAATGMAVGTFVTALMSLAFLRAHASNQAGA